MIPLLIALFLSSSVFFWTWLLMSHVQSKQISEERIAQFSRVNLGTKPKKKKKDNPLADGASPDTQQFFQEVLEKRKQRSIKSLITLALPLPITLIFYVFSPENILMKFALTAIIVYIGSRVFTLMQARKMRSALEEELPSMLDLLMICVEGGMSINAALVRVAGEMKNSPLAMEFRMTFHELNAGVTVENAFRHLGERCNVPDIQALATSIIQSEKLGMGLAETLRNQARLLRETIRMRTKEKIMKVPIKMMIPLAFFIMPAIFTVILGPAVIQIKTAFSPQATQERSNPQK